MLSLAIIAMFMAFFIVFERAIRKPITMRNQPEVKLTVIRRAASFINISLMSISLPPSLAHNIIFLIPGISR